jgi:hypothetical protein
LSKGIRDQDDWYRVTRNDILQAGGEFNKHFFDMTISEIVISSYPELKWLPWRFEQVPRGYWDDINEQREFFDWVYDQLQFSSKDDWYNLSASDIIRLGGSSLLYYHYNNSPSTALMTIYPNHDWKVWKFQKVPQGHWDHMENQREFFDWIAESLCIHSQWDWYKVTKTQIIQNGGESLLSYYQTSPSNALISIYADSSWQLWRFQFIPKNYWESLDNQLAFIQYFEDEIGILHLEDWYNVTNYDIISRGGLGLLTMYEQSICQLLMSIYNNFEWQPWRFEKTERSHWDMIDYHRKFFDTLGESLDVQYQEDWYKIKRSNVIEGGGGPLLDRYYDRSIIKALRCIYPDANWQPWRFETRFVLEEIQTKEFLEWMENKFRMENSTKWLGFPKQRLMETRYGRKILRERGGSMMELLRTAYPEVKWNTSQWYLHSKSNSQELLYGALRSTLSSKIEIEKEATISIFQRKKPMRFDIWIPSLNVAIEYQGIQHFVEDKFIHWDGKVDMQCRADMRREFACKSVNISLLNVPFWWDFDASILAQWLNQVSLHFSAS